MITKVVNFFKSKSVIDFLYLVMMIIVVTMIKDMVVSMYRKKGEMRWLDETFKKKEGFTTGCGGGNPTSTCDRLKFLTCGTNFDKLSSLMTNYEILKNYIDADWVRKHTSGSKTYYRLNTKGANVYTGHIYTYGGNINTAYYNGTTLDYSDDKCGNIDTGYGTVHTRVLDTEHIRGRNQENNIIHIDVQQPIRCPVITGRETDDVNTSTLKIYTNGGDISTAKKYNTDNTDEIVTWTHSRSGNIQVLGGLFTNVLDKYNSDTSNKIHHRADFLRAYD